MIYAVGIIINCLMVALNLHYYISGSQNLLSLLAVFFNLSCVVVILILWIKEKSQ